MIKNKSLEKIRQFSTSNKTKGVLIIAFLFTCFSYFVTNPLFYGASVSLFNRSRGYMHHGFPWDFSLGYGIDYFNLFYFILDLIFWFIVIELFLTGINLIKEANR